MPEPQTRRDFLKGAAALTGAAMAARGVTSSRPPNVVLLISDDQGWGDYSFMGHPTIQTPRLDQLVSESLLFTRGYVAAPLCCPSLASILTGLHPHQNRITSNDPNMTAAKGNGRYTQPEILAQRKAMWNCYDEAPTLPRLLSQRGYRSFQSGKWWGGNFSRGGFTSGMTHGDPFKGGRHGDQGLKIGRETMQPVTDFVDGCGADPFLLWFAPMLPHQPHNPPERLIDHYRAKHTSMEVVKYWAMCEWWDEVCGQVLDCLDERGLADNTLVLYVCDNGWIQDPNKPRYAPRSKRSPYEGGLRTPILARWPGQITPRRDETTLVSSIDLAPTALYAAGVPVDPRMQGLDLRQPQNLALRDSIYAAAYSHDARDVTDPVANLDARVCYHDQWKLIAPHLPNQPEAKAELYDVVADPEEQRNLAAEHPERVRSLWARLQAWWPIADQPEPRTQ